MHMMQSRRDFLASASLAAAAGVISARTSLANEGPPETTTIRLRRSAAICFAPKYLVETFLRAEGFEHLEYVDVSTDFEVAELVTRGDIDFEPVFAGVIMRHLDVGLPVTAVGGLHVGCYELFAREPIRHIGDLKGRRVGIHGFNSGSHFYMSIMAKHIGLDPQQDIEWVPEGNALDRFVAGDSDAFLGFPPEPQMIRAQGFDRVILNTTTDKPWSHYFCCMLYGNRAWVRDHPVATKRFLRAMNKASEFCTTGPEAAARQIVDDGFIDNYDHALDAIRRIPYDLWHEYDAEDTLRFYALRLHEAGMLDNSPNALLADGTDWRFVNELKRELKA